MSDSCSECGTGSRGAFLVDVDGETVCTECADAYCKRCGQATTNTTISGDFICQDCQKAKRRDTGTRDAGQGALDDFA